MLLGIGSLLIILAVVAACIKADAGGDSALVVDGGEVAVLVAAETRAAIGDGVDCSLASSGVEDDIEAIEAIVDIEVFGDEVWESFIGGNCGAIVGLERVDLREHESNSVSSAGVVHGAEVCSLAFGALPMGVAAVITTAFEADAGGGGLLVIDWGEIIAIALVAGAAVGDGVGGGGLASGVDSYYVWVAARHGEFILMDAEIVAEKAVEIFFSRDTTAVI